ncbi:hypothetical protein [Aurantiacibacter odishensis]|uniref:hypothetical protein n=1 Tax=Aurantiacibacter odishensis TaxID=1155476 RepID=UPI000E7358FD|nr:hypothetical protein [Aurantiacibacter odishensis]
MYRPIEIGSGLISATMVATASTAGIVSVVSSIDDLFWLIENNQSISMWPIRVVFSAIGTAGAGVVFGFIGAVLFLAVGLLPLLKRGSKVLMIVAGGLAGLAHSIVGWALRIADNYVGPLSQLEGLLLSVGAWGGFLLTDGRQTVAIATVPASIVGGCAAGWIFYHIVIGRPPATQ